jgi:hypothetical protein
MDPIFLPHQFLKETKIMRRKVNVKSQEVEKRVHHMVPLPSHVVGPIFHHMNPFQTFFAFTELACPKTEYIKPLAISRRGGGETENIQYISEDCDDRRGDSARSALRRPFAFIDTISIITMMKRE